MKKIKIILASLIIFPSAVLAQYSAPTRTGLPDEDLDYIIINIMEWMLAMIGIVGIIGFVIAGVIYLVSAGDDTLIGKAKMAMKYCIVGIIVALMGFVIIQAVDSMLNGYMEF